MYKANLCKSIGEFFGDYFEEDGKLCIDNGDQVFRYDTPDELLKDWVETLVENHHDTADNPKSDYRVVNDSWEEEIVFIYSNVIGEYPTGIRPYKGKRKTKWRSSVDVLIPGQTSAHGKQLFLGTYSSIVDAIFARRAFRELVDLELSKESPSISLLTEKAEEIRLREKEEAMKRKAPICPHCGKSLTTT